jgi:hypothetical protein
LGRAARILCWISEKEARCRGWKPHWVDTQVVYDLIRRTNMNESTRKPLTECRDIFQEYLKTLLYLVFL